MKNVHTYQLCASGEVSTQRFNERHNEESQSFMSDVGRSGLPFQNAIRLVNKWNGLVSPKYDTRYWLVLS